MLYGSLPRGGFYCGRHQGACLLQSAIGLFGRCFSLAAVDDAKANAQDDDQNPGTIDLSCLRWDPTILWRL